VLSDEAEQPIAPFVPRINLNKGNLMTAKRNVPDYLRAKEYHARVLLARAVRDSEAISDMLIWDIGDAISESDLLLASERARDTAIYAMKDYLKAIDEVEVFKENTSTKD
jgi:hypothetical protein